MNIAVWAVSVMIIATKFLDCYTTSRGIRGIGQEENPFVAVLMKKIGVQTAIWGIFGLSVLLIICILYLLESIEDKAVFQWVYVVAGTCIAAIQFAVAHTNHTRRFNAVTKIISRVYRGLRRMVF